MYGTLLYSCHICTRVTLKWKLYQYSHYRYLLTKLTTFAIEIKSHVISEFILHIWWLDKIVCMQCSDKIFKSPLVIVADGEMAFVACSVITSELRFDCIFSSDVHIYQHWVVWTLPTKTIASLWITFIMGSFLGKVWGTH